MIRTTVTLLSLCAGLAQPLAAQDRAHALLPSPFGSYGENGLPFFGQTLDARHLGDPWPTDNLTPRGIILNLGHGIHACFDPDLLRIALIWQEHAPGDYLTMSGMAPGSYRQPHRKAAAGQAALPRPVGTPLFATGMHPGMLAGSPPALEDPRSPSIDGEEKGLGPLPPHIGLWIGLGMDRRGPVLAYEIQGVPIEEQWEISLDTDKTPIRFQRILRVGPGNQRLTIYLPPAPPVSLMPSDMARKWIITYNLSRRSADPTRQSSKEPHVFDPHPRIWEKTVPTKLNPGQKPGDEAFVREKIPLPLPNPWKRNVRPSDFDFFPDGRLALLTFDGDVWIADDVTGRRKHITWQRFAGGLHEPMGIRIVDGQVVVFDRNGLVTLRDRDRNGEADFYANLCSLPAQTAETREFAMGFELKPEGGFFLSKGGQVHGPRGKLNGTILEVSADGKTMKVIATGLRQPFLGVDPVSGTLTASDQQGHWVPSTPLHVIKPGSYYGFQPVRLGPKANEGRTINEPPLWIPHFVNQSGARQVWLRNARMATLNDSLIHVGYNQPALFRIYLDAHGQQGAVAPLLTDFPTGLLSGRVNPVDGRLYVGGFNLWGTTGKEIQGLYRVRPTGKPSSLPSTVRAFKEGVVLRFDHPLDHDHATSMSRYSVDRWNYQRTPNYGSGHFRPDGSPGQEPLALSCIYLSEDHQSVFLGIPGMKPIHSLRITCRLEPRSAQAVYLSIKALTPINLTELGFEETKVHLASPTIAAGAPRENPTAERGSLIATRYGCLACHSTDGTKKVTEEPSLVVGPTWKGLFQSERTLVDDSTLQADESYLRESILHPAKRVARGFETQKTGVGMPSYLGVLNENQLTSLILYLKSLR